MKAHELELVDLIAEDTVQRALKIFIGMASEGMSDQKAEILAFDEAMENFYAETKKHFKV